MAAAADRPRSRPRRWKEGARRHSPRLQSPDQITSAIREGPMSVTSVVARAPRAARSSRILVTSFGATLFFIAAVVVALVFSGKDADAATYTLTSTVPTTNWSDTTKWSGGPAGTFPGQSAGDTAVINLNGFAVSVDVTV